LTTLPEAVASAERVQLARQYGLTVLVGHSFAGMIVAQAGIHPNVSVLVYVAARHRTRARITPHWPSHSPRHPRPPESSLTAMRDASARLLSCAISRATYRKRRRKFFTVQEPFKKALLAGKTTQSAWRLKPSWYAVSTEDRTINPDLERYMAKRVGAKTIEVKAGHLWLISHPDVITGLIFEAAGQRAQPSRPRLGGRNDRVNFGWEDKTAW
jgi:pimeloyl-ACP methyl ester carboxylesterase